jgi:hypothetical protein
MKEFNKMLMASCWGVALALFGSATRADANYQSPALDAAESSFSAFLADFNGWDARLNYQPLVALASTPDQDRSPRTSNGPRTSAAVGSLSPSRLWETTLPRHRRSGSSWLGLPVRLPAAAIARPEEMELQRSPPCRSLRPSRC